MWNEIKSSYSVAESKLFVEGFREGETEGEILVKITPEPLDVEYVNDAAKGDKDVENVVRKSTDDIYLAIFKASIRDDDVCEEELERD